MDVLDICESLGELFGVFEKNSKLKSTIDGVVGLVLVFHKLRCSNIYFGWYLKKKK